MASEIKYLDWNGLSHFLRKIKEIFISDAPIDGKKYLRQDNNWVEYIESQQTSNFDVVENVLITSTDFQTVDETLILR